MVRTTLNGCKYATILISIYANNDDKNDDTEWSYSIFAKNLILHLINSFGFKRSEDMRTGSCYYTRHIYADNESYTPGCTTENFIENMLTTFDKIFEFIDINKEMSVDEFDKALIVSICKMREEIIMIHGSPAIDLYDFETVIKTPNVTTIITFGEHINVVNT